MAGHGACGTAASAFLLVNCLLFLAFGIWCLVFPSRTARAVDLELKSPSAFADMRAMYGGLSLAIGSLLLEGLYDPAWSAPSVFLATAASAGMASARLYSIVVSGVPNSLVLVGGLLAEVVAVVWGLSAYRGLGSW